MAATSAKDIAKLSNKALIKVHAQEASDCYPNGLRQTEAGRAMLAADADRRASIAARALELWRTSGFDKGGRIASELLRANSKEWTVTRLIKSVEAASLIKRADEDFAHSNRFPQKPLIAAIEKVVKRKAFTPELRVALEGWKAAVMPRPLTPEEEGELGDAERAPPDDDDKGPWAKMSAAGQSKDRLQRIRTPLPGDGKRLQPLPPPLRRAKVPPT